MSPTAVRSPLPAGAAAWARTYIDTNGMPAKSAHPVPVDADERRTAHIRHRCPHKERVEDGTNNLATVRCSTEQWLLPDENGRFCPEHGLKLEPDEATSRGPMLPWQAMWSRISDASRPVWLLAAEAAAGISMQATHLPPGWAALAAAAATGGGYAGTRVYLARRARGETDDDEKALPAGRRLRTLLRRARTGAYTGAVAGAWLLAADITNPHTLPGLGVWAALPGLWAVASHTWRRYITALSSRKPEPQPVEQPDEPADDGPSASAIADAQMWARDVAGMPGGLQHTSVDLSTWEEDTGGRRMVIRAERGAITDETLRLALPHIAGAFNIKRSAIGWVEEYEESPRKALLLLQPKSPLNDTIPGKPVDVLSPDDMSVHMGLRIDGSELRTRLFTPGWGAPSRLITGVKGSGKTELLRRMLKVMTTARILRPDGTPTRLIAPFLHDPKRGADYGLFTRAVCGFSVDSNTLHMIVDALIREMDRRYDLLATTVWTDEDGFLNEGETPFDPATMGPVISLICDEFHQNAKDQALLDKLEPFGRKMRAAGIEINVATHGATIGDTGSQVFRDMLAGGEAWLLRTTNGLNAALATGGQLVGDPRALPRIPGMVLHASGEGPTMQARVAYDDPREMRRELYDRNYTPLFQRVEWPQETLEAFGSEFVEWMEASQGRKLGQPFPTAPADYLTRDTGEKIVISGGSSSGARRAGTPAIEVLRRMAFAAPGPISRAEIRPKWEQLGFGVTSTLSKALKDAKAAGWLVQLPGNGVFEMTASARARMQEALDEDKSAAAEEDEAADEAATTKQDAA